MNRTPLLRIIALTGLLLNLALPVSAQDTSATVTPATSAAPALPPVPLDGRESYTANCAPCHGATGLGDGPSASGLGVPPAALGQADTASAKSLAEWFDITKNGRMQRMMPPWKERLTDEEIWNTVAYAWGIHTNAAALDSGKTVYEANCASCHGPDGKGATEGAPNLADFATTSAASQATWAQAVANGKGAMPAFSGKLSEAEQSDALTYLRSLSMAGPLVRPPLARGTGVISGTVTNRTTGQPMAGATVQLGIFDQTALQEQRETKTDAAGLYRFDELSTDPTAAYATLVEYPIGVPYNSEFVTFTDGRVAVDLPISVYEVTNDPTGIRAERIHYIMEFDAGQAMVAELVVLSLDGERAYADANAGLKFAVPATAQNLSVNEEAFGDRFQQVDGGFVDLLPLQPGQNVRQVIYRYTLPITDNKLDFTGTLTYPANAVNALISDVGQQVSSDQLQNQGKRETDNGAYYNLVGQDLSAGQQVIIRLSNLSVTAGIAAGSGTGTSGGLNRGLLFVIIGLAAAIAALLVALPMLRGRLVGADSAMASGPADRDSLIDALAQLDLAFENGELGDAAYREQRLRLKAQLRDLLAKDA